METLTLEPIDDSRLGLPSASNTHRLIACPGSWRLEHVNQSNQSSEWAERGTRIHAANETGDVTDLPEDEANIVERARAIEEQIFNAWVEEFGLTQTKIFREERLYISYECAPICSVKMDFYAVGVNRDGVVHALDLDLKSGRKAVTPPASNWQLRTGAVALFREADAHHVRVAIVQPLAKRQSPCDYDRGALMAAYRMLVSAIAATKLDNAPLNPGIHCEFCPARMTCPETLKAAQSLIDLKNSSWDVIPPELKPLLLRRAKMVIGICEDIKKRIEGEVDAGLIPDLVRAPGTNVRSITDPVALYGILSKTFGPKMTPKEFAKITDVSIGKDGLEGLVRDLSPTDAKGKPITWDAAKAWVNDACAPVIEMKQKKGSIIEAPKMVEGGK